MPYGNYFLQQLTVLQNGNGYMDGGEELILWKEGMMLNAIQKIIYKLSYFPNNTLFFDDGTFMLWLGDGTVKCTVWMLFYGNTTVWNMKATVNYLLAITLFVFFLREAWFTISKYREANTFLRVLYCLKKYEFNTNNNECVLLSRLSSKMMAISYSPP